MQRPDPDAYDDRRMYTEQAREPITNAINALVQALDVTKAGQTGADEIESAIDELEGCKARVESAVETLTQAAHWAERQSL